MLTDWLLSYRLFLSLAKTSRKTSPVPHLENVLAARQVCQSCGAGPKLDTRRMHLIGAIIPHGQLGVTSSQPEARDQDLHVMRFEILEEHLHLP